MEPMESSALSISWNPRDVSTNSRGTQVVPSSTTDVVKHQIVANTRKAKKSTGVSAARPIDASALSKEDEIIISMKCERASDKQIADHLRANHNLDYVPKTIGTRWARLRKKMAEYLDEQLDEGIATWRIPDDAQLIEAVSRAREAIDKLKIEAEGKMWHLTQKYMHDVDRRMVYSTKACRKRYECIASGGVDQYPEMVHSKAQETLTSALKERELWDEQVAESQEAADTELKEIIAFHINDNHGDNVEAELQTKKPKTVVEKAVEAMQKHAQSSDTSINGLPTWMNKSARLDKQIEEAAKELKEMNLPPISAMKRRELVGECMARGFQSTSSVDTLRTVIRRARKGFTDMPKAAAAPDIIAYKRLLIQKRVWEYDGNEAVEENEGEVMGATALKKKAGGTKIIATGRTITRKRPAPTESQNDKEKKPRQVSASTSVIPAQRRGTDQPARKKTRIEKEATGPEVENESHAPVQRRDFRARKINRKVEISAIEEKTSAGLASCGREEVVQDISRRSCPSDFGVEKVKSQSVPESFVGSSGSSGPSLGSEGSA